MIGVEIYLYIYRSIHTVGRTRLCFHVELLLIKNLSLNSGSYSARLYCYWQDYIYDHYSFFFLLHIPKSTYVGALDSHCEEYEKIIKPALQYMKDMHWFFVVPRFCTSRTNKF